MSKVNIFRRTWRKPAVVPSVLTWPAFVWFWNNLLRMVAFHLICSP